MMTTTSIGALYVGRLIIGIGNGFLMTFSQLYIQVRSHCVVRFRQIPFPPCFTFIFAFTEESFKRNVRLRDIVDR